MLQSTVLLSFLFLSLSQLTIILFSLFLFQFLFPVSSFFSTDMDSTTLHHSTSSGSGHHEVHLCHRCNWPFPNPHPSSRHRRAHKRICGTVKGYEIDQSNPPVVSDDSDENNTEKQSPVVEKGTQSDESKEVVSTRSIDGVGKFSRSRSEEDVFSDAITEFSDGGISSSTQNEDLDHKTIEGDFSASSKLKVVDDSADKTDQLNDPTNIDQKFESGAMVNAMDHFEGIALTTDAKLEPISVGHGNGLQSETDGVDNVNELCGDKGTEEVLVKAIEDTATPKEESDLDFSTLDCEEEKLLNPVLDAAERKDSDPVLVEAERKELVAEVAKHDSSGPTDTSDEIDAAKEVKTEVSDSVECSSVVPVDSFIGKDGDNGSFGQNEEESISDMQVKTECLNGGSGNGEVAKEVQEKLASKMQSDHSTETPSDLYCNAEILEEGSKLESRDNAIEISTRELESETPCDTQVKNDVKEVEPITVAGTKPIEIPTRELESETPCDTQVKNGVKEVESVTGTEPKLNHIGDLSELKCTHEQNESEILTKSFGNENKGANEGEISIEPNHDENLAVVNKIQQESSLGESLKEKLPSCEDHTDENFTFTPVLDKSTASPVNFQVVHESSAGDVSGECKSVQDEGGDVIVIKENEGISQSAVSAVPQTVPTEDKSGTNLQEPKPTTDKTDDFEPPSFMTLVNPASEIETVQQTTQHPKTDALQAGWFPSLTNVVNESEGRKKNEEKIAKVTQHTPLKNLLVEAKSPNAKQIPSTYQKEEVSAKENGADVMKVNSAVDVEAGKEMDKEWDSPAKYPIESKNEKKKKKGFWMPFACCSSSVHRDLQ